MERPGGSWIGSVAVAAGLMMVPPHDIHAQSPLIHGSPQVSPQQAGPAWSGSAYPGDPSTRSLDPTPEGVAHSPTGQVPGMPSPTIPNDTGAPPSSGQWPGATMPQLPTDIGAPPSELEAPGLSQAAPGAAVDGAPSIPSPTPFSDLSGAGGTPGLDAVASGPVPGLGGVLGGEGAGTLTMLGDSPPVLPRFTGFALRGDEFSAAQIPPPVTPPIPGQPQFGPVLPERLRSRPVYSGIRGIKICENQSPMPQDRVYFSFNYFNDVNGDVNRRLGSPITNIDIYRYILGFEKTFAEGRGSFGMRLPLDNLGARAAIPGLLTESTAIGDLLAIFKYALYYDRLKGDVFTAGLLLGIPTGPDSFAGFRNIQGLNNFRIQPFVGYIYNFGNFYIQGFSSISVPTDDNDVTVWYNDNGIGYFLYRSTDANSLIRVVAPTFEVHVNTPLNHSDPFDVMDPAGLANYVNFTYGVNIGILQRGLLSVGYIHPVTDPQPFNGELAAMFNIRF